MEVISDEVAVISLNTMYFYDSNKGATHDPQLTRSALTIPVVSGCAFIEPNDPGNLQIDWVEVQLEMYRNRGMQVRVLS